jgi:2-polyprenyl-6-methoxyphenol hydroxylase-like FAD-dependent oxidoreductase
MRVLISGAGIAGPTPAYSLDSFGFDTTIVEKSARLRTGDYVIDFWGVGSEVADRMKFGARLLFLAQRAHRIHFRRAAGR